MLRSRKMASHAHCAGGEQMLGNKNQSHRGGRGIGQDERQGVPKQPYEGNRIPFLLPEQSGLIENGFPHSHASRAVSSSIALRGHSAGPSYHL